MNKDRNLIWVDLEMTGLDVKKDVILEIATIVTDSQLNLIARGPEFIIHQPGEVIEQMNKQVKEMHTKSGLIEAVKESNISIEQAESENLAFFKQHCDPNTALLSGNSVWQDRNFLQKYMPSLVRFCYYRILDVTAIKELVSRWYPDNPHAEFEKKDNHRAMDDILESIEELKHYRKYFFVKK